MIIVLGVIALLVFVMIFMQAQGQGKGILDSLFDWFKNLLGGV
jgi:hypothetical protein